MADFLLTDEDTCTSNIDFSTDNLTRLDPEIRLEHVYHPDGSPGIKFYKPRAQELQGIGRPGTTWQPQLTYSPELFLVLRLDTQLGLQGGFNLESYAYNEQLINSWNSNDIMGSAENICFLIYRYLNSDLYLCTGIQEENLGEKDINKILIERYGDSTIYRSRNCDRIVQSQVTSDSSSQLCLACANLCHKQHDDFLDQELNRTKSAFKHELNDVIGDENTDEFIESTGIEDFLADDGDIDYKPNLKKSEIQKSSKRLLKKKRKYNKKDDKDNNPTNEKIKCNQCDKSYSDPAKYEKHIQNSHNGPLSCPISTDCEIRFRVYLGKNMKSHLRKSHADDISTPIRCGECREIYPGVGLLLDHMEICRSKPTAQNTCELCGQIYKTMGGLNQHIRIFHEKKRFQCQEPDCNKEFNTKNSLADHISCVHKNARAFICTVCGKDYKYRHERRICEDKHAGKFLHHCQLCDKKFNIKRKFDQHIRVHTGEKPYSCPICAYRCARLDNLNTHTKKSHGMGYKDAESVTGISATSTTKITIVPPQDDITDENEIIRREPIFINEAVVKNKLPLEATLKLLTDS